MPALFEYRLTASGHDLYPVFLVALNAIGREVRPQRQGPTL